MGNFERLCEKNPGLGLKCVCDESFRPYGEVVKGYDLTELIEYMKNNTEIPEGCRYCPSVPEMEATEAAKKLANVYCGGMPSQFGYTNGTTSSLDALEYHKSSELVIAVTDLVVLVARRDEIVDKKLDSSKVKAFFAPAGTAFEMYATTLHYAPCKAQEGGYKSVVVLPKGTNYDITKSELDETLWGTNKWLIAHPDVKELADEGAATWITGENIKVNI